MEYMRDDQAKRGTWKAHGKPSVIRYYGRTNGEPTAESDLATVEALPGGLIRITNLVDDHAETIGAASLFYAAPTTMDEANGTGEHGAPPATPFGDSLIAMVDEMTAEPEVTESALVTVGTDRYGRAIPEGCKDVKLNLGEAWRTTYTHIQAGDRVRMQDRYDHNGHLVPAATQAPKTSKWREVQSVERTGETVTLVMADEWGKAVSAPHTAITRQERDAEYRARLDKDAANRAEVLAEAKAMYPATVPTPAPTVPPLVTGHDAESHSRRGRECRICGQPVVDHESVNISDGVAVCWWMGAMYGQMMDPGLIAVRTAMIEARREAARTEVKAPVASCLRCEVNEHEKCRVIVTPSTVTANIIYCACACRTEEALLSDIEEWQTAHRDGRCDGLFIPDAYAHEVTVALWNAGRIVPGSKVAPGSGRLGWFSVRMIDADHAEALTMDARTEVTLTVEVPPLLAECKGCPTTDLGNHESWCPTVTPMTCECESFVCEFNGAHALCECTNQATETHFVALCPGCAVTVRQPVSPEAHEAFLAWEASERVRRNAEEAAEIAALPDMETQVEEISTALADGTARWSREKGKGRKARKSAKRGKRKAQKSARKISRKGR